MYPLTGTQPDIQRIGSYQETMRGRLITQSFRLRLKLCYKDLLRQKIIAIKTWLFFLKSFTFIKTIFMTKPLRFLLVAISFFTIQSSFSQVTLITPSGFKINGGLVLPNGRVLMVSRSHSGLYTTDGTSISLVTDSYAGNDLSTPTALQSAASGIYKGELYFTSFVADSVPKLYATDGTSGGTRFIAQINKTGNPDINDEFIFNNLFYFIANDDVHGNELWSTDGTTANTRLVADINGDSSNSFPGQSPYYPYNNTQFFINESYVLFTAYGADSTFGLYKLTASGVSLLENNFADSTTLSYDTTGSKTFFIATSGSGSTASNQLWVTDGISTSLLYNSGAGFTIYYPRLVDGKIVFGVKNNNTYASSLWSTDGTTANTKLFKNISSTIGSTTNIVNNKLVFAVHDSTGNELWSTDGTAANTILLLDTTAEINESHIVNNKLLFTTSSNSTGNELWSTDGTAANTKAIKHIRVINDLGLILNNKLIFSGYTSTTGTELWSTDGTAANTILLKDIVPGSYSSDPIFPYNEAALQNSVTNGNTIFSYYTLFKGKYYFTANEQLWSTDGTPEGTTLITNISVQGSNSSFFYTTTGIYFTEEDEDRGEFGLWVTDGTAAGTKKIEGYGSGNRKSEYLFVYNHQLYFNNYYYDTEADSDLYKIDTTVSILPVGLSNFTASLQPSSVLLN